MRVLTLTDAGFADTCRALEKACAPLSPDCVVGIATGGAVVAAGMFAGLPHLQVSLHRPSTAKKQKTGWLAKLLPRLPRPVCDMLRIAEARLLALRPPKPRHYTLPQHIAAALAQYKRILVVDDAIDSGATMAAVDGAIARAVPGAKVYTAAITVTTRRPLVEPTAALYRNGTLIRFPWSLDR